ncbi:MAG: hypothetical protein ACYSU7_07900, partial [Planctomycetota bacterium]
MNGACTKSARVAGWRGVAVLGLACAVAALVNADPQRGRDDGSREPANIGDAKGRVIEIASTRALESEASGGMVAGGTGTAIQFMSGFEPPCDITANGTGYIGGGGSGQVQSCEWHASVSAPVPSIYPQYQNTLPLTGAQQLHFQYDPNQASGSPDLAADAGSRNWAFSDDIVPTPTPGVQHLSLWVRINTADLGNNAVIIQPQAPSQALLTTVFVFNASGVISVGDDDGDCANTTFAITATTAMWVAGEYKRVDICVDNTNDRIRYWYDGNFIYSTGAGEGGVGGPNGCGVFAGTAIEHVLVRYEGNNSGGSVVDVDDVLIESDVCPEVTGACCDFDGQGGCSVMTEDDCDLTATGVFAGPNTDCTDPNLCVAVLACATAVGDCFTEHAGPGCDDPACCLAVCDPDTGLPLCCQTDWLAICVQLANETCQFILCAQPDQNCQGINVANASTSTGGSFNAADNFTPAVNGTVNALCWYGAYLPDDGVVDDFSVTYYTCTDGVPDTQIAQYNQTGLPSLLIVQPRSNTNLQVAGLAPIYEYQATHPNVNVQADTEYFIEIVNHGPDPTTHTWF